MIKPFDTAYYPYYGNLNAEKRKLYQQLLAGYQKYQAKIPVTVTAKFQDASEVIAAICCDHPELFWVCQKATITHTTADKIVTAVTPEYYYPVSRIPQMQKAMDAAVRRYLSAVSGKGKLEQERIIHDKLANETSYVHGAHDQSAYAALVEHKAVCAGYTRAFQLLMQKIGIPCYYCYGDAKGRTDTKWDGHAWNILKLGSDCYNMDLTWDDGYDQTESGKIAYTYYNCTDRQMKDNHRRDKACGFLPACNGVRYSFQGITGNAPKLEEIYQDGVTCRVVIRTVSDFKRYIVPVICKTVGHKAAEVSFPVEGEKNYTRLKNEITKILQEELSDTLYHIHYLYTDFNEGWYKIKVTVTFDDPLERICADGVTCRHVVRSEGDFKRHIIPVIRKNMGRTTTVSFPVEFHGKCETFRATLSESIRDTVINRTCTWTCTCKHYCGDWYWLQYKIEYK